VIKPTKLNAFTRIFREHGRNHEPDADRVCSKGEPLRNCDQEKAVVSLTWCERSREERTSENPGALLMWRHAISRTNVERYGSHASEESERIRIRVSREDSEKKKRCRSGTREEKSA
jgi:hypothetical protein